MASGCAPIEVRERQQLDATLATAKGESLSNLSRQLALRGYICSSASPSDSGTAALECSKQRSNFFPPYTCIFRVELQPDAVAGENAATATIVTPACAGL